MVLSLGSNFGDRKASVASSLEWLGNFIGDFRSSSIYETPCAVRKGPDYLNAVVCGEFSGTLDDLQYLLKKREADCGRDESKKMRGEVPIDIDIVIADGKIIKEWDARQKFFIRGFEELRR